MTSDPTPGALAVAVVGPGHIGGNIAALLSRAGHRVTLTFSRDPDGLAALAHELGASYAESSAAVAGADVVVVAVPWSTLPAALEQMGAPGGALTGTVVIDTTNQFGSGPMPAPGQTAAAFNAARMPGAHYAKSFNTLTAGFQRESAHREPGVVQWLCGSDEHARAVAARLVADAGYLPVDLGGVETCAVMEAPRRPGAVYGEEYRRDEAEAVAAAVRAGRPIPPTPSYEEVDR